MNWDLNFLLQTSLITVCAVIAIPAFLRINKAIPKEITKYFYILTGILFVEGCESYIDHVLSLVPDNRYELIRIVVSVVGYVVRPMMLYLVLLIMTRDAKVKYRKQLLAIPASVTFVIAMMAFFTKSVFYYDEQNAFHGGPLRNVMFVVLIVYYILILIVSIRKRRSDIEESRVIFGIIVLLLGDTVLSIVFNDLMIHEQVVAIAVFFYFVHFMSVYHMEKVDELHTTITKTEARITKDMLDQSMETLAYTIDAKDQYTKGHSFRVAKYARMIASLDGKDAESCRQIYLAGLLHDIGKISIDDAIINKKGKLTDEEYAVMKKHPAIGNKILEKMRDYPFLQEGAGCHHERFDGMGYPNGLKGMEIPEIARIIAVADAYDAMTSHRSYRETMDQADVKQEIWKGAGTQFDPYFAKLMVSLIDADINYEMRERPGSEDELSFDDKKTEIVWEAAAPTGIREDNQVMMETRVFMLGEFSRLVNNWENPSEAVSVTENGGQISFFSKTNEDGKYLWFVPTAIIFGSDSGLVIDDSYEELGVFIGTGYSWRVGATLSETSELIKKPAFTDWEDSIRRNKEGMQYFATAKRVADKVLVTLENEIVRIESELYLPADYEKDIYLAVTGERCSITNVSLSSVK